MSPPGAESPEHRDLSCLPLSPLPGMGLTQPGGSEGNKARPEGPRPCGLETQLYPTTV